MEICEGNCDSGICYLKPTRLFGNSETFGPCAAVAGPAKARKSSVPVPVLDPAETTNRRVSFGNSCAREIWAGVNLASRLSRLNHFE